MQNVHFLHRPQTLTESAFLACPFCASFFRTNRCHPPDTFKRGKYQDVILPFTVLRRLDCVLAPTKEAVLEAHTTYKDKLDDLSSLLRRRSGYAFYNISLLCHVGYLRSVVASWTQRKPTSWFVLNGCKARRLLTRRSPARVTKDPPRIVRRSPLTGPRGFCLREWM